MQEIKTIENAKQHYQAIRSPVRCFCLNQDIHFNADGFNHLIRNGLGKPRTQKEINYKTRLIRLAVPVLKSATDMSYEQRTVKKNRKKGTPLVQAEYWGVEAVVGKKDICVRVIIRRIGNGRLYFHSIMLGKNNNKVYPD